MRNIVAVFVSFAVVAGAGPVLAQSSSEWNGYLNLSAAITQKEALRNLVVTGGYDDDKKRRSGGEKMTLDDVQKGLEEAARDIWGSSEAPSTAEAAAPSRAESVDVMAGDKIGGAFFRDPSRQVPIAHSQAYETAGYITESVDYFGEIVDGESSAQFSFSYYENVYLDRGSRDGVRVGDKFLVFHAEPEEIVHPVTGEALGRKIVVDGVVKVVKTTDDVSEAKIVKSYDSIERGDKIVPYEEVVAPGYDPDAPVSEKGISGYLVSSKLEKSHYGAGDVIYLDVGASAGVEPGDVFEVIDTESVVRQDGKIVKGLPKIVGMARVLTARDNTSSALVFASKNVMVVGDKVRYSATR